MSFSLASHHGGLLSPAPRYEAPEEFLKANVITYISDEADFTITEFAELAYQALRAIAIWHLPREKHASVLIAGDKSFP